MEKEKKIDLLDYFVILVKWKKLFILILLPTLIISYLAIYFLIDEQFDSISVIIPAKDESLGGISSLMGNLQNLPLGIGNGVSSEEMGMYNTILMSRTMLKKVIAKFDLINVYKLDINDPEFLEKAIKILSDNITTTETPNFSYELEVRAPDPQLSADINNYLVQELNKKIVELKIEKSKNNRVFLEKRVEEIKFDLKLSEDSLTYYQEKSGMLEAEEQVKEIMSVYGELETELISKQIEVSILRQLYPNGHPLLSQSEIAVNEYTKKLEKLKRDGQMDSPFLSFKSLPKKTIEYYRYFRDVEINSKILEFILPLYEQAKFDEQKDVPVLQVVDYADPPVKKSFPPRTIFTLLTVVIIFLIIFILLLIKENQNLQNSAKVDYIKQNIFKW